MKLVRLPLYLEKAWWLAHSHLRLAKQGVKIGEKASFHGVPIIFRHEGSTITIGDRVGVCSDPRHTALGVARPVILRTLRHGASISIGSDTGLSGTTICSAVSVRIGERCLVGADVMITDTDFHQISPSGRRYASEKNARAQPVSIGDDVFVGARTIILPGVTIGEGSVVGAGSVVTRDIPAFSICAGNPARIVRAIDA